jgi:UDP-glucose 4-epimerase
VGLATDSRAVGEVFNVGGDREITIKNLAGLIKEVARSGSPIVHIPYSEVFGPGFEDMPRRVPDTRKLRALLGWQPTVSLEQILDQIRDHRMVSALRTA